MVQKDHYAERLDSYVFDNRQDVCDMTVDWLHRYNTIDPMKPPVASRRSSTVSNCSPTSTSDWLRKSRGLQCDEHPEIHTEIQ